MMWAKSYVIHSQFYDNQEEAIVEDTFRKVVLKTGTFDTAYLFFNNVKFWKIHAWNLQKDFQFNVPSFHIFVYVWIFFNF